MMAASYSTNANAHDSTFSELPDERCVTVYVEIEEEIEPTAESIDDYGGTADDYEFE